MRILILLATTLAAALLLSLTARATPIPLDNVVQLALGGSHSCALRADGSVRCWGNDSLEQLGRNSDARASFEASPVAGLSDAVLLAAGGAHTCALRATGQVVCWGGGDGADVYRELAARSRVWLG